MKTHSLIAAIAFLIPIAVQAEDYIKPKLLAEAYIGHCVLNAGRIDKVKAAARVFDYSELEEDMALMLASQNPNADFQMWAAGKSRSELFFLGVSESELDGKRMAMCVIAHPYVSSRATISEIQSLLNFGKLESEETLVGQRTRIWDARHVTLGGFIVITDVQQIGEEGGTYGFMAPLLE